MSRRLDSFMTVPILLKTNANRSLTMTIINPAHRRSLHQRLLQEPESRWYSRGTHYEDNMKQRPTAFYMTYGGEYVSDVSSPDFASSIGGLDLQFVVVGTYDASAAQSLAYWNFFARVAVTSNVDGTFAIGPSVTCKFCGKTLVAGNNLEWKVCPQCTASCPHEYHDGIGTANGVVTSMNYCGRCGRANPEWKPFENAFDGVVDAVARGLVSGVLLRHPDGSTSAVTSSR